MEYSIAQKLKQLRLYLKETRITFSQKLKIDNSQYGRIEKGEILPTLNQIMELISNIPMLNLFWLLSNSEEMFISENENSSLNPLIKPDPSNISYTDWFQDITDTMEYYGDSMKEYPKGCILALRKIKSTESVIWGEHYVIELEEGSITRIIQPGEIPDGIRGYSSSTSLLNDGSLQFPPIDIPQSKIKQIFKVLGYITKNLSYVD